MFECADYADARDQRSLVGGKGEIVDCGEIT